MKKLLRLLLIICVPVLIVSLWFYNHIQWIEAGEVGIVFDARGGLRNEVYRPQALFIGPFQQLFTYPTRLQNAVYTQDSQAGEVKAADGISITTNDNANTVFDVSVLYRVEAKNAVSVFKSFGQLPIEEVQSQHIRRAVREAASVIGNKYDIFQLMGPAREEASGRLLKELQQRLGAKGITIEDAMILNPHPAQEMLSKINQRVNSYTLLQIADLNAQIAEVNRKSAIVTGTAQQKAAAIAAGGTVDKSLAMIDMDLTEQAIDKWNGKLSPYSKNGKQTLVIGSGAVIGGRDR